MEDKGQSDAYRSAWLLAERELEIRQFLATPPGGWWQVYDTPAHDGGLPAGRDSPVPEPLSDSTGN